MRRMVVLIALLAFVAGAATKTEVTKTVRIDTVKAIRMDTVKTVKWDTVKVVKADTVKTVRADTVKVMVYDTLKTTKVLRDTAFTKVDTVRGPVVKPDTAKAIAKKK